MPNPREGMKICDTQNREHRRKKHTTLLCYDYDFVLSYIYASSSETNEHNIESHVVTFAYAYYIKHDKDDDFEMSCLHLLNYKIPIKWKIAVHDNGNEHRS